MLRNSFKWRPIDSGPSPLHSVSNFQSNEPPFGLFWTTLNFCKKLSCKSDPGCHLVNPKVLHRVIYTHSTGNHVEISIPKEFRSYDVTVRFYDVMSLLHFNLATFFYLLEKPDEILKNGLRLNVACHGTQLLAPVWIWPRKSKVQISTLRIFPLPKIRAIKNRQEIFGNGLQFCWPSMLGISWVPIRTWFDNPCGQNTQKCKMRKNVISLKCSKIRTGHYFHKILFVVDCGPCGGTFGQVSRNSAVTSLSKKLKQFFAKTFFTRNQ